MIPVVCRVKCGGVRYGTGARRSIKSFLFILLFLVIDGAPVVAREISFPELRGRVVDEASVLNASDEQRISALLQEIETKSTDQIVVVTVKSLQGMAIEDYGIRLARHWEIGQAGKDNGVLLIVAPIERRVRIEVGRGLEGVLPDALAGLIIRRQILPLFKKGRLGDGILAGVKDIQSALNGDKAELEARSKIAKEPMAAYLPLLFFIFWLVPFLYFLNSLGQVRRIGGRVPGGIVILDDNSFGSATGDWRRPGDYRRWYEPSRYDRGFPSGGGFSGGGGSFGGGGASGSW